MADNLSVSKLMFPSDDKEKILLEARQRGYLSHTIVELADNRKYPVTFYSVGRLSGELMSGDGFVESFIADVGLFVLADLTEEAMENAVRKKCKEGYFEYFVPLTADQLSRLNDFGWPP